MENELDKLLEAEARNSPALSTRLMENMIADAATVSATRADERPLAIDMVRSGWWKRALEPFGGMPALAAAATCAIIGGFVGYSGTDALQSIPGMENVITNFEDDPLDDFSVGALTNFDDFLAEG